MHPTIAPGALECHPVGVHYGDDTSHPLAIDAAKCHITVLASQRLCTVHTELTVCNEATPGSVAATLRFPLPAGAAVCELSIEHDSKIIEAVSVPKRLAAEVAYKEKEKGRSVGTTRHVSGSVWQVELYPLPHGVRQRVCVAYVCELVAAEHALALHVPLAFTADVDMSAEVQIAGTSEPVVAYEAAKTRLVHGLQLTVPDDRTTSDAALVFAPGATATVAHFSAFVSRALVDRLLPPPTPPVDASDGAVSQPVLVVVDVSRSCAELQAYWPPLLRALHAAEASRGRALVYSLYALSTGTIELGRSLSLEALEAVLVNADGTGPLLFDGGTNLALLDNVLEMVEPEGRPQGKSAWAYAVLLSDGSDSLLDRRRPTLTAATAPIHAPLPPPTHPFTSPSTLKWLANQTGGCTPPMAQPHAFAAAVCDGHNAPRLAKLTTDLSADLDATLDDVVTTVPDALLQRSTHIGPDGLHVSGRCDTAARVAPSTLTLTLQRGSATAHVTLPIPSTAACVNWAPPGVEAHVDPLDGDSAASIGRLLAARYALMAVEELTTCLPDARAAGAEASAASLASSYGLATGVSTLLLLARAEQFAEHEIECPAAHPAHEEWLALCASREETAAKAKAAQEVKAAAKLTRMLQPMMHRFEALGFRISDIHCHGYRRIIAHEKERQWHLDELERAERERDAAARQQRYLDELERRGSASSPGESQHVAELDEAELLSFDELELNEALGRAVMPGVDDDDLWLAAELEGLEAELEEGLAEELDASLGSASLMMPSAAASMPSAPKSAAASAARPSAPSVSKQQRAEQEAAAPEVASAAAAPFVMQEAMEASTLPEEESGEAAEEEAPEPAHGMLSSVWTGLSAASGWLKGAGKGKASRAKPAKPFTCDADVVKAIRDVKAVKGGEAAYREVLRQAADIRLATRPSYYIYAAELLREMGVAPQTCARVLWNVLEVKLADSQTCRVVGYHLLALSRWREAVAVFELVLELAPAEPHSHVDLALATLQWVRTASESELTPTELEAAFRSVVARLVTVLTSTEWPDRFQEIEWPCLVLLSWAVDEGERRMGDCPDLWPEAALPSDVFRLISEGGGAAKMGLFVWLGWDTDQTDVDLHVTEPAGEEVFYSHPVSHSTNGRCSRDFTQGFGPEVYMCDTPPPGRYKIDAKYYASHQASRSTGSTSAVLWCVCHMGDPQRQRVVFGSVRLVSHKSRQTVLEVKIPEDGEAAAQVAPMLEPMPRGTINALLVEPKPEPTGARNFGHPRGLRHGSGTSADRPMTDEERELAELEQSMAM